MIQHLDTVLRRLFRAKVPDLTSDYQVRFEPPDAKWREYLGGVTIAGVQAIGVSVYLADVRENRMLRSDERIAGTDTGYGFADPAPARIDCHYLVTVWDIAKATQAVESTRNEHRVLADVISALLQAAPLNPSRIMPPGAALNAIPELIRDADLPTTVLPVEGFAKLAEFWSSMGDSARWRPGAYLVVTLPVALERTFAGPLVTTANVLVRGGDEFFQIGGVVHSSKTPRAPVANAWVRVDETGVVYTTDEDGRFRIEWLNGGRYHLSVLAAGFQETTSPITVPQPSGRYDVGLVPL
jgi:hypothetical protein